MGSVGERWCRCGSRAGCVRGLKRVRCAVVCGVVWLQGSDWWGVVAGLRAGASVVLGARPAWGSGPTGVTRVWCWICVGERLYRPGCAPHTGLWAIAVAWACDLDADAQRARREASWGRRGTALGGRSGAPGRARRPYSAGWCAAARRGAGRTQRWVGAGARLQSRETESHRRNPSVRDSVVARPRNRDHHGAGVSGGIAGHASFRTIRSVRGWQLLWSLHTATDPACMGIPRFRYLLSTI